MTSTRPAPALSGAACFLAGHARLLERTPRPSAGFRARW
jgi:hypothetical protein